jgi:hypothetical protein
MILKNNRWYDENNNSWSANIETEESAQLKSNSLINCKSCYSCYSCKYCNSCTYCYYCKYCNSCDSCDYCKSCNYCYSCYYCNSCNFCNSCNYCKSCQSFKKDPERYFKNNIGSRSDQIKCFWLGDKTTIICGCFTGTLKDFEKAVKKIHGDNKFGRQYKKHIATIKTLMSLNYEAMENE